MRQRLPNVMWLFCSRAEMGSEFPIAGEILVLWEPASLEVLEALFENCALLLGRGAASAASASRSHSCDHPSPTATVLTTLGEHFTFRISVCTSAEWVNHMAHLAGWQHYTWLKTWQPLGSGHQRASLAPPMRSVCLCQMKTSSRNWSCMLWILFLMQQNGEM